MLEYALLAAGIMLLSKGADWLVDGASSLAKKLGVPTLVIGLTIVAFGTSLPELIVNVIASMQGSSDIAIGNVVGSNIANILLILGISALSRALKIHRSTVWNEIPLSLLAAIALFAYSSRTFLDDASAVITKSDGIILLLFFGIFLYYVATMALSTGLKADKEKTGTMPRSIIAIALGIVALYFGGRWVVEGAVILASSMGVSEYLISATIIAVGTSLPELFTSISAARKGEDDMAVGNIVGSNIFNIFFILGISALLNPITMSIHASADILILLFVTALLFVFMFIGKRHTLEKSQGAMFLVLYLCYIAFLIIRG
ncbi:MAG: calcium/sodium antiporter [Candidatus Aenigmarchaeota archaeon]|nr:calcium/sodium antiporter [Candidatus Aenigmarchaeota archaeon]